MNECTELEAALAYAYAQSEVMGLREQALGCGV